MLTIAQMASIRRHMGVPVAGLPNSDYTMSVRTYDPEEPYFAQVGLLENRMLNLAPAEEATLTGHPMASLVLSGTPLTGATISITATIGATPQVIGSYTATGGDLAAVDVLYRLSQGISSAINVANNAFSASVGPHNLGTPVVPAQGSLIIIGLTSLPFTLTLSATGVGAYVADQGVMPDPSVAFTKPAITLYGYLPILNFLEGRTAKASEFAAFKKADVIEFDSDEILNRVKLYNYYRGRLSDYFGIKLNPLGSPRGVGAGAGGIA